MTLRRIGVMSLAKVLGVLYAGVGLVIGAVVSVVAVVGAAFGAALTESPEALAGAVFGVGAVIVVPILYGVLGFVGGALGAWIYNLAAGVTGGITVEFEAAPPPPTIGG